jgi:hypothetical protein
METADAPNATSLRRAAAALEDAPLQPLADVAETGSARARLEIELGGDLARLLVDALADRRPRAGVLTAAR